MCGRTPSGRFCNVAALLADRERLLHDLLPPGAVDACKAQGRNVGESKKRRETRNQLDFISIVASPSPQRCSSPPHLNQTTTAQAGSVCANGRKRVDEEV